MCHRKYLKSIFISEVSIGLISRIHIIETKAAMKPVNSRITETHHVCTLRSLKHNFKMNVLHPRGFITFSDVIDSKYVI